VPARGERQARDGSSLEGPPRDGRIDLATSDGQIGKSDQRTDAPTGCTIFPADNPWNTDISGSKVHANSTAFISAIGASTGLHPDFGTVWNGAPNGIPYLVVPGNQPLVPVTFDVDDESDTGPYPIPLNAPIEGGPSGSGDRHVLGVDLNNCQLYELFAAYPQASSWKASSGARFDLRSNKLRPIGWTSADAAGLPIYPGLVRYDEVKSGAINHALRFTVDSSQKAYVLPATHYASSSTNASLPPMGLRLRLKASTNISTFSKDNQVILTALKKYGMFVADNGSAWYISGAPSSSWNDEDLANLSKVKGSDFEVVDTGPIKTTY
jgi:hypothetical protein